MVVVYVPDYRWIADKPLIYMYVEEVQLALPLDDKLMQI